MDDPSASLSPAAGLIGVIVGLLLTALTAAGDAAFTRADRVRLREAAASASVPGSGMVLIRPRLKSMLSVFSLYNSSCNAPIRVKSTVPSFKIL